MVRYLPSLCLALLLCLTHRVPASAAGLPDIPRRAAADSPGLSLSSAEPRTLPQAAGGTLSIYGEGFGSASVARLVGYGLLPTTVVNGTAIAAQVPAGVPAGEYAVEVSDEDSVARLGYAITILAATPMPAPTAVPTPPPSPPPGRPILTIRSFQVEPAQVRAGDTFDVSVEIYNNGSRSGENTMAVFPGGVFVPVGEPGHMIWQLHINHTAQVSQRLRAPANLTSGVYHVQVHLSANDWAGDHYDYPQTVPVEVVGKPVYTGKPEVTIEGVQTEPRTLVPGQPFTLTLHLANRGSRTAINVFAQCVSHDRVVPAAGSDTVSTPLIAIEDTTAVTLPLLLRDDAPGGRVPLAVALTFGDYDGGGHTAQETIGVDVDASLTGQARLLVQRYGISPETISPGDTFTLTLHVANVGGAAARGVVLSLGGEGGAALEPFSPVGTGNVVFVSEIDGGATAVAQQLLVVDGGAPPKAYNLPLALDYETASQGSSGGRRSDTQRLSLIVRRRPELRAIFYRQPEWLGIDVPTAVSLEVLNVGSSTVDIQDLGAVSSQLGIVAEGTMFFGPLDPGGTAPLDITVTPRQSGDAEIVVTVAYRDDLNQRQVLTRTLQVDVPASALPENLSPAPTLEKGTSPGVLQRVGRALRGFLGFGS